MSMGLSLADTQRNSMSFRLLFWSWVQPDASITELGRILVTEENDTFGYHAYTFELIWGFEGFWESLRSRIFFQGLTDTIDWELVNPLVPLEMLSRGAVAPENLRKSYGLSGSNLQDFAAEYLHTFLNSRASMEGWRLLARKMFVGATASEASSMNIIEALTSLWRRQFALQPFEIWVRRALGMLLEDLAIAGIDLEEYMRWEAIRSHECSYEGQSIAEGLELRPEMRIPESGPALVIHATGRMPSDWAFSWDPCVEELSGEFLSHIEQRIPGAWVDFDPYNEQGQALRYAKCHKKQRYCPIMRLMGGKNKLEENKLLRVRGMTTCEEMFPLYSTDRRP
jgi:hypothetical protein